MAAQPPKAPPREARPHSDRLDSWKAIAAYLERDLRTVQRWEEKEGLPVHRHLHSRQGSIYAYKKELDDWWAERKPPESPPRSSASQATAPASAKSASDSRGAGIYALAAVAILLAAGGTGFLLWQRARQREIEVGVKGGLAVLPFEVPSTDLKDEVIAAGLTDDIITDLGRAGQFPVVSRTSTMQFAGRHQPLPQIAQRLHVGLVIEGMVVRSGDRVRVTAQLIDAMDDRHLWAASYERDYTQVLTLEDDIAGEVADAVSEALVGTVPERSTAAPVNSAARMDYLMGRFFWNKRDEPSLKKAINYFDRAVAEDPNYGAAYSGLADCYNLLSVWGSLTASESFPEARKYALKAIQLNPESAEAYTSLAFETYRYGWNFREAERDFQKAISLNPNYVTAHQWYGEFLSDIMRSDQGIAELRKAEQLNPLSAIVGSDLAVALIHAGRYQQAVAELQRILTFAPSFVPAHLYMVTAYRLAGQIHDADEEYSEYVRLTGDSEGPVEYRIDREWTSGRKRQALADLESVLRELKEGRIGDYQMAVIYLDIGNKKEAFACLNRAYQEHSWWLVTMEVDPGLAPLHNDPRFEDLVRRVGLPE